MIHVVAAASEGQTTAALVIAISSLISAFAAGAVAIINAWRSTASRTAIASDLHLVADAVPAVNRNDLITDRQGNVKG